MSKPSNPYIFGDAKLDRQRLETQSRLIARYVRARARAFGGDEVHRILDVGCGEGQLGFALQDVYVGAELVGIDRDPHAIETARQRAEREFRTAHFVAGDVHQTLPDGPFDLVFMCLLLMHTQQPAAVLAQAYSVMRPGATLWIIDATEAMGGSGADNDGARLFALFFQTLERIGSHPHIMSELPTLLQATGFTDYTYHDGEQDNPFASSNLAERTQVNAAGLGAIYNACMALAKVNAVPLAQIDRMFASLANTMVLNPNIPLARVLGVVTVKKPGLSCIVLFAVQPSAPL